MLLPQTVIANADDFGLRESVNKAILHCYEHGYINSTSLMVNQAGFDHAVDTVHTNKVIQNIGIHVDFATGRPISNFSNKAYLTPEGYWNLQKINRKVTLLNNETSNLFYCEIEAQLNQALKLGVRVTHIDSHYHLHALPCFYRLFLTAARKYNLKMRIAQTYNEGKYINFLYRKYLNQRIMYAGKNYSDLFETVERFISHKGYLRSHLTTEVMLHPDFDVAGKLTDPYLPNDMANWVSLLEGKYSKIGKEY